MFKIGDFSKLSMVSIRMLRYYDDNDIFKPVVVDSFTGYRYYSAKQIHQINTIITLRDYGFSVLEIGAFLSSSKDTQQKMLIDKQGSIAKSIENEKQRYNKITSTITNLYKENISMEFKVNIKSVPSMKAIALRDTIPAFNHEGILWERLGTYIEENKISVTDKSYATYYDKEYKESNVDVEVLMEVKSLGTDDKDIVFKETETIDKAACILVPGDYSNIAPAFEYLGKWLEETGNEMTGMSRQVPIKGPWNESDPKNYLTELQCPIK